MSNGDIPPFFLLPLNPRAPNIVTVCRAKQLSTESDSVCVSTRSIMKETKFESLNPSRVEIFFVTTASLRNYECRIEIDLKEKLIRRLL